ncbi:MAG: hypothetical protein LBI10_08935 [Deltaproteobacteria bacterium]|nr:hypothetical protein [Deltaproteobacteria bacterium]
MRETESARPKPPPTRRDSGLPTGGEVESNLPGEGGSMFVKSFRVEGADFLKPEEIKNALAPYEEKDLTLAQIVEATDKLTVLCRQKGYMMAKAFLPRQNARDGVLLILVATGQYGALRLENHSLVKDGVLEKIISRQLRSGQPIRRPELERTVTLIGDLAGAQLPQIYTSKGATPESADFQFNVQPSRRFNGYLVTDNQGSYYTGRWRFMAGGDLNSPFGLGDKLSLYGLVTDTGGMRNVGADYYLPLGGDGLLFNFGYSRVDYELGEEYEDTGSKGWVNQFKAGFSYPLQRTTEKSLYLDLFFAHNSMVDEVEFADYYRKKRSTTGTLKIRREAWSQLAGRNFYSNIQAGLTLGHLKFPNHERALEDKSFADTGGSFGRLNLELVGNLALTDNFTFLGTANFQKALNRNLDSSEQLNLTNVGGVRVFRETVSGDEGYAGVGELRYRLPSIASYTHYLGVFYYLAGWKHENDYDLVNSENFSGAGFSYNAQLGPGYLNMQVTKSYGEYPYSIRRESRTQFFVRFILTI